MQKKPVSAYQVTGTNDKALFSLKLHRGEGMVLLAMNWKHDKPPLNFVGFSIEYMEPGGKEFWALKNRICFPGTPKSNDANQSSSLRNPFQKFRWVHFPMNAEMDGAFTYKVKPVFMNDKDELSYGEAQIADIVLARETYPGKLNVTFTRGFISSQAFCDRYDHDGGVKALLPSKADDGLDFEPTHPQAEEALSWMGFEAVSAINEVIDAAVKDKTAKVSIIAYDLNLPGLVDKIVKLKKRVRIIIDDSGTHGEEGSAENKAAEMIIASAGVANVKRQHMGTLQHNKTIIVRGKENYAIGGSTNFSWRAFYVQANNAVIVRTAKAVKVFQDAFEDFWNAGETPEVDITQVSGSDASDWQNLGITDIDASITFSPHSKDNAKLDEIADDISKNTTSSLFYSLAFLYQTPGKIHDAIVKIKDNAKYFSYGMSDRKTTGGLDIQKPDGNVAAVFPSALSKDLPEPFKSEPTGGGGIRMHHKFVVIDFDKPTARVYMGSYNFSSAADLKNGENLLVIKDKRIATSYMVEALRLFDHYHFRVAQAEAKKKLTKIELKKPPKKASDKAWWLEDYTDKRKVRDREIFS